jgi:hypothetical protein
MKHVAYKTWRYRNTLSGFCTHQFWNGDNLVFKRLPMRLFLALLLAAPLLSQFAHADPQYRGRRGVSPHGPAVHRVGVDGIAPSWASSAAVRPGRYASTPRPLIPPTQVGDPASACEAAVAMAEYAGRLPPRLAVAIALTESGRPDQKSGRLRPWPWTINAEGEGHFFANKQEAIAAARALQARGVQSMDVGCMQVNLMYHPNAFHSLDEAFDPRSNATYAVRFLNDLFAVDRDWLRAVAAYHSQTPLLGEAYRDLVLAHWHSTTGGRATMTPRLAAYADFLPSNQTYAAFTASTRVYGAFTPGELVPPTLVTRRGAKATNWR